MPRRKRSQFGQTRRLPSGRGQARYTAPGTTARVNAPTTYETRQDAEAWLRRVRDDLVGGRWRQPDPTTFRVYAETWLSSRLVRGRPLKPRTKAEYERLLDKLIVPALGRTPVRDITPENIM